MAQFVFQLEAILRHRKNQEKQRQRELAVIASEMAKLEASLGSLNGTLAETLTDMRNNRLVGKLDLAFLAHHRRYLNSVQRKSANIAQEMTQVRKRLDVARANLTEAAKLRKMMEKLREKQLERWKAGQEKREFLQADDIGTQLAFVDSREPGEDAP